MADVFISYARGDKARVAPLVAAIEAKGWSVWWDPAIAPGQEFDRQITKELENAAAVLVVWTPTSVESRSWSCRRRATTDGEESGLGLGFFIAKTLLERSGASIDFENRTFPDRGAVIRVHWARSDFERLPGPPVLE